jgi:hypothetical protein
MDSSVHEARWVLAPLFGLSIGFLALGFLAT